MTRKKKLLGDQVSSSSSSFTTSSSTSSSSTTTTTSSTTSSLWLVGGILFVILVEVAATAGGSEMGSCWRLRRKNGSCGHVQRYMVTREACCSGVQRRGWSTSTSYNSSSTSSTSNSVISEQPTCSPCSMLCDGVKCGEDRKCVVRCGAPKCVCSPQCHLKNKEKVCGSDGRTYASECHLLKRACRKKKRVLVAHYGPCQTCSGLRCRGGKQCVLNEQMTPMCIRCPPSCPRPDRRPLCGADGRTYTSRCSLKRSSCRAGSLIPRAYMGACQESSTCDTVRCWGNQTCLTSTETGQPQCTECNDHLDSCRPSSRPVCASDGKTYPSWCAFRHEACRSGRALTPALHQHCAANHTKADDCKPPTNRRPKKAKTRQQELDEEHKEHLLQQQAFLQDVRQAERLTAGQTQTAVSKTREVLLLLEVDNPNSIDGGGGSGQQVPEETTSSSNRDKKKRHRRRRKKCKNRKRRRKDRREDRRTDRRERGDRD